MLTFFHSNCIISKTTAMEKRKRIHRFWKAGFYLTLLIFYACVQKEHFVVLNAEVPDKIPVVSDIAVVVYQDCEYGGYSLALREGEYNLSDLISLGIKNKDLSSLKIADGYEVTFFDQVNFNGASMVETANADCLEKEGWNNRISSLKISKIDQDIE